MAERLRAVACSVFALAGLGSNRHRRADDVALPCRHTQMIYKAARGPKQMWIVPGTSHAAALGRYPAEFRYRVLAFYGSVRGNQVSRVP